jgi:hypothetical protein
MDHLEKMCVDVHLDEGPVTEILLRLPARSVLRFRAVCKDWLRNPDHGVPVFPRRARAP